jgi:hypothetical protein
MRLIGLIFPRLPSRPCRDTPPGQPIPFGDNLDRVKNDDKNDMREILWDKLRGL